LACFGRLDWDGDGFGGHGGNLFFSLLSSSKRAFGYPTASTSASQGFRDGHHLPDFFAPTGSRLPDAVRTPDRGLSLHHTGSLVLMMSEKGGFKIPSFEQMAFA
jgi:hypothetical protein